MIVGDAIGAQWAPLGAPAREWDSTERLRLGAGVAPTQGAPFGISIVQDKCDPG